MLQKSSMKTRQIQMPHHIHTMSNHSTYPSGWKKIYITNTLWTRHVRHFQWSQAQVAMVCYHHGPGWSKASQPTNVNWNYRIPPQKKSFRIPGSSQPNTSTRLSGRSFSRMEDRAKADLACCCSRELNWSAKCKASCSASCGFYFGAEASGKEWVNRCEI